VETKLQELTGLTRLCLRQNLLSDPSEVELLRSAPVLLHLELRDNQLSAVPSLHAFSSLTYLELSYNEGLRSLAPLAALQAPALEELYAASNKMGAIEGVSQLTSLRVLELGSNRIRAIEGLATLGLLRELWLGRNRVTEIANLEGLASLRRLSLQSNRLTSTAGLQGCTGLEELYLSHNGIEALEVSAAAAGAGGAGALGPAGLPGTRAPHGQPQLTRGVLGRG
jgi:protein phosphatase 1 regulatory subunit 7